MQMPENEGYLTVKIHFWRAIDVYILEINMC